MAAHLQVDEDNSGEIEFSEFCKVIVKHKAATAKNGDECDTLDAFVALGGKPDKTGKISTDKLRATIKVCATAQLMQAATASRLQAAGGWMMDMQLLSCALHFVTAHHKAHFQKQR